MMRVELPLIEQTQAEKINNQLIDLYAQIAAHTQPECKFTCRAPMTCCGKEYCLMAKEHAKDLWLVDLEYSEEYKRGETNLPFMGKNGCIVAPHLRFLCALHTCEINSWGFKKGDETWTARYFELRTSIEMLEMEKYKITNLTSRYSK